MFKIEQIKKSMPEATFELFTEGFSSIDYISNWTLVGGTALSIYLQHRLSEDLDFFIGKSTLDQERSRIEKMIENLENKGYNCVITHSNSENLDYEIEGVKVTFFSSGLKNLKSNCVYYKNIEVASIETIIVMKMEAIINYRTKTRDFYDIYSIGEQEDISIFNMLDMYNNYTNKKGKEELLYARFVTKDLDNDDEGLDSMEIKKKSMFNFSKLREWIINEVKKNKTEEEKIILGILENPLLIKKYKDFKFGFQRMSLSQKLSVIGQDDMLIKCLELKVVDILYEDISGKNLLDYYLLPDDNEVFGKILQCATKIPSKWLNSKTYKREDKLEAIQCEHSVINSIENNQSYDRMRIVAEKCAITFKVYLKKVTEKKNYINGTKNNDLLK